MEHQSYRKDDISSEGTQVDELTEMLNTKQTEYNYSEESGKIVIPNLP